MTSEVWQFVGVLGGFAVVALLWLYIVYLPGRTLEVDVQPCAEARPGRLMVWFVDTTRANRFIREHFVLLLHTAAAPPCP